MDPATEAAPSAPELHAGPAPPALPVAALTCLLAATQELQSADDLGIGLRRVAVGLKDHVPYDNLAVLLLDELGRELAFTFTEGYPPEVAEHWRFGIGQGIVGTVAKTGMPLRVDDVHQDRRYIHASEGTRSELAVPLVARTRTIGVLDVGAIRPGAFTDEHERLLAFFAGHLAAAIENARLNRNLLEHARTLSLLHELSREFTSILHREELVERVAELLKRHVDYDVFGVHLWREDSQRLEPWISLFSDGRPGPEGRSLALGQGICGTAAALRQVVRVPNVHLDPRYVRSYEGLEVRSELVVPLVLKDRLLGVMMLDSGRYDAFRPWHEQLLATLASSIAIALENARLYEQLRREEDRMQADLATAREVQRQLLPKATPWIAGLQVAVTYNPARQLAGDFYDFLAYGEGRIAIAVGDVAGKSTSAALYGSLAIGILREYAAQNRVPPARVLGDMNDKLRQLKIDNRFLAMLFAVYEASTRTLRMASSGLPYPYLLRPGTNPAALEEIPVGGVPLGMLSDQKYGEALLELGQGDALVVFSDGVIECHDEAGEEFGQARLEETLRRLAGGTARQLADGIMAATDAFARAAEAYDDRTVVVLEVTAQ